MTPKGAQVWATCNGCGQDVNVPSSQVEIHLESTTATFTCPLCRHDATTRIPDTAWTALLNTDAQVLLQ